MKRVSLADAISFTYLPIVVLFILYHGESVLTAGDLESEGWQTFHIVMSMNVRVFSSLLKQLANCLWFVTHVSDVDGFEYCDDVTILL